MSDSKMIFTNDLRKLAPANLAEECWPELNPGCELEFCQGLLEGARAVFVRTCDDGQYLVRLEGAQDMFARIPPQLVGVVPPSEDSLKD
jgi:hypothetical protein